MWETASQKNGGTDRRINTPGADEKVAAMKEKLGEQQLKMLQLKKMLSQDRKDNDSDRLSIRDDQKRLSKQLASRESSVCSENLTLPTGDEYDVTSPRGKLAMIKRQMEENKIRLASVQRQAAASSRGSVTGSIHASSPAASFKADSSIREEPLRPRLPRVSESSNGSTKDLHWQAEKEMFLQQLDEKSQKITYLEGLNKSHESSRSELQKQNMTLNREVGILYEKMNELQSRENASESNRQVVELEEKLAEVVQKVQSLESDLQNVNAENSRLEEENKKKTTIARDLEIAIKELEYEVEDLAERNAALKQASKETKPDSSEAHRLTISHLQDDLNFARKEVESLNQLLTERSKEWDGERYKSQEEMFALKNICDSLKGEKAKSLEEHEVRIKELLAEMLDVQEQLENSRSSSDILRDNLTKSTERIEELESENASLLTKLEDIRNTSEKEKYAVDELKQSLEKEREEVQRELEEARSLKEVSQRNLLEQEMREKELVASFESQKMDYLAVITELKEGHPLEEAALPEMDNGPASPTNTKRPRSERRKDSKKGKGSVKAADGPKADLSGLQSHISALQTERDVLSKTLNKQSEEIARLKTESEVLKSKIAQKDSGASAELVRLEQLLKDTVSESSAEVSRLQLELDGEKSGAADLIKQVENISSELEKAQSSCLELQTQLSDVLAQLSTKHVECAELKAEIDEIKSCLAAEKEQSQHFIQQVAASKEAPAENAEAESAKAEVRKLIELISQKEGELAAADSRLKEMELTLAQLKHENVSKQQETNHWISEVQRMDDEYNSLQEKCAGESSLVKQLEEELETTNRKLNEVDSQLMSGDKKASEGREAELRERDEEISSLIMKYSSLQAKLHAVTEQNESLQAQLSESSTQLTEKTNEVYQLQDKLSTFIEEVEEKQSLIDDLNGQVQSRTLALRDVQDQLEEATVDKRNFEEEVESRRSDVETWKSRTDRLTAQLSDLQRQLQQSSQYSEELQKLREELEGKDSIIEDLEMQLETQSLTSDSLQEEILHLKKKLESGSSKVSVDELAADLASKSEELKHLRAESKKLADENKDKHVRQQKALAKIKQQLNELAKREETIKELREKLKASEEIADDRDGDITELTEKLRKAQEKVAQLTRDLDIVTSELEGTRADLATADSLLREREDKITRMNDDLRQMSFQLEENDVLSEVERLRNEVAIKEMKIQQATEHLAASQDDSDRLENFIAEMKKDLESSNKELEAARGEVARALQERDTALTDLSAIKSHLMEIEQGYKARIEELLQAEAASPPTEEQGIQSDVIATGDAASQSDSTTEGQASRAVTTQEQATQSVSARTAERATQRDSEPVNVGDEGIQSDSSQNAWHSHLPQEETVATATGAANEVRGVTASANDDGMEDGWQWDDNMVDEVIIPTTINDVSASRTVSPEDYEQALREIARLRLELMASLEPTMAPSSVPEEIHQQALDEITRLLQELEVRKDNISPAHPAVTDEEYHRALSEIARLKQELNASAESPKPVVTEDRDGNDGWECWNDEETEMVPERDIVRKPLEQNQGALTEELHILKDEVESLQTARNELQNKLETITREREGIAAELTSAKLLAENVQGQIRSLEDENEKLAESLDENQRVLRELEIKRNENQIEINRLAAELDEARKVQENQTSENTSLQQELARLQAQHQEKQDPLSCLESSSEELRLQLEKSTQKITELEASLGCLRVNPDTPVDQDLAKKYNTVSTKLSKALALLKERNKTIQELEEKLKERKEMELELIASKEQLAELAALKEQLSQGKSSESQPWTEGAADRENVHEGEEQAAEKAEPVLQLQETQAQTIPVAETVVQSSEYSPVEIENQAEPQIPSDAETLQNTIRQWEASYYECYNGLMQRDAEIARLSGDVQWYANELARITAQTDGQELGQVMVNKSEAQFDIEGFQDVPSVECEALEAKTAKENNQDTPCVEVSETRSGSQIAGEQPEVTVIAPGVSKIESNALPNQELQDRLNQQAMIIDDLRANLSSARSENASSLASVDILQQKLTDANDSLRILKGHLQQANLRANQVSLERENIIGMRSRISELDRSSEILGSQLRRAEHEKARLEADLQAKIETVSQLEHSLDKVKEQLELCEGQNENYIQIAEERTQLLAQLEAKLRVMNDELNERDNEVDDLRAKLKESDLHSFVSDDVVGQLQEDNHQLTSTVSDLKSELELTKKSLQEMEVKGKEFVAMRSELQALKHLYAELQTEKAQQDAELEGTVRATDVFQQEVDDLTRMLENSEQTIVNMKQQLADSVRDLQLKAEEVNQLSCQLIEASKMNDGFNFELDSSKVAAAELQAAAEKKMSDLQVEIEGLLSERSSIKSALEEARATIVEQKKLLEVKHSEYQDLSKEFFKKDEKIASLEADITTKELALSEEQTLLRVDIDSLKRELEERQNICSEQAQQISSLQVEVTGLRHKTEENSPDIEKICTLEAQLKQLSDLNEKVREDLESELSKVKDELARALQEKNNLQALCQSQGEDAIQLEDDKYNLEIRVEELEQVLKEQSETNGSSLEVEELRSKYEGALADLHKEQSKNAEIVNDLEHEKNMLAQAQQSLEEEKKGTIEIKQNLEDEKIKHAETLKSLEEARIQNAVMVEQNDQTIQAYEAERLGLYQQLQSYQTYCEQTQEQVNLMQAQIAEKATEIEQLQAEAAARKEQLSAEVIEQHAALQSELAERNKQIDALKSKVADLEEALKSLDKYRTAKEQLIKVQEENKIILSRLADIQGVKTNLELKLDDMTAEVSRLTTLYQQSLIELQEVKASLSVTSNDNQALQQRVDYVTNELATLGSELTEVKLKLSEACSERDALSQEKKYIEGQLSVSQKANRSQQEIVERLSSELEKLATSWEPEIREEVVQRSAVSALRSENVPSSGEADDDLASLMKDNIRLTAELRQVKLEKAKMLKDAKTGKKRSEPVKSPDFELKQSLDAALAERESFLNRIDTLEGASERLVELKEQQDQQVEVLRKKAVELQKKLSAAELTIINLEAQLKSVGSSQSGTELAVLEQKVEELELERTIAKGRTRSLENELAITKSQVAALSTEISHIQSQPTVFLDASDEVEFLRDKTESLQNLVESLNEHKEKLLTDLKEMSDKVVRLEKSEMLPAQGSVESWETIDLSSSPPEDSARHLGDAQVGMLKRQVLYLEAQIAAKNAQIVALTTDFENLKKSKSKPSGDAGNNAMLVQARAEVERLSESLADTSARLSEAERHFKADRALNETLQSALSSSDELVSQLRTQIELQTAELAEFQDFKVTCDCQVLKDRVQLLATFENYYNTLVQAVVPDAEVSTVNFEDILEEVQVLVEGSGRLRSLENERNRLCADVEELTNELQLVETTRNNLENELTRVLQEKEQLEKTCLQYVEFLRKTTTTGMVSGDTLQNLGTPATSALQTSPEFEEVAYLRQNNQLLSDRVQELTHALESSEPRLQYVPVPSKTEESVRKDLDDAMRSLHERDVRCEEFTWEITKLLEERDTLQLKLSTALRQNLELHKAMASYGATSDSNEEMKVLGNKLEELRKLNYNLDVQLRREKEERRRVEQQLVGSPNSSRNAVTPRRPVAGRRLPSVSSAPSMEFSRNTTPAPSEAGSTHEMFIEESDNTGDGTDPPRSSSRILHI